MSVTRAELLAAQKPLLDLLGVASEDAFAEGITIHRDHVSVTVRARLAGDTTPRSPLLNRVVGLAPAPSRDASLSWTFDVPIIQPPVGVLQLSEAKVAVDAILAATVDRDAGRPR